MRSKAKELNSGQLLAKNFLINLFGKGIPALVALVTIPLLINGMGSDRFGLFNLLLVTVGYFSLFELGIGRAITKFVSEALATGDQEGELTRLLWSSFALLLALGLLAMVLLIAFTPYLVKNILNVPAFLIEEGMTSLLYVSLSLPLMLTSAGVHGILEAQQRFDRLTLSDPFRHLKLHLSMLILLAGSNNLSTPSSVFFARIIVLGASFWICVYTLELNLPPAQRC